ncbi:putative Glycosyl transferase, group 1 [Crenothrix polyspora]|uniref:Putative Glycosyl transferase, group 1 n=2 Tax=Crenothrix polyspora TaxID=360316 RepID=A0A1R4H520_9GAMM|nr:putative Glycosyl transferase, group 1 [Crenothrix polyspora]
MSILNCLYAFGEGIGFAVNLNCAGYRGHMMNKKISLFLPNLTGGGAERISVNLANELIKRGYSVDMVLLTAEGPCLALLNSEVRVINFKIKHAREGLLPLVRYFREAKPHSMIACMWPLTVLAVAASKFPGVSTRIVVAEHNTWSRSQADYSPLLRQIIRTTMYLFFPGSQGIVAVSNGAADDLANFAGIKRKSITMIYNPVSNPQTLDVHEDKDSKLTSWKTAEFRILNVGSLKTQKNQELLLRAFSILLKRTNAHLLILGDGHLRQKLEKIIAELGIKDNVSMPGFADDPRFYYQHASLFALSSDWEGLPTVLIEALEAGTPIVSTDCPSGPREILNGGQLGKLVPLGDADALASAMYESLNSKHDKAILKERAQCFSIGKATDQYIDVLFPRDSLAAST